MNTNNKPQEKEIIITNFLKKISGELSSYARDLILHFMDVGEFTVALETLCSAIIEEKVKVDVSILPELFDVLEENPVDNEILNHFRTYMNSSL